MRWIFYIAWVGLLAFIAGSASVLPAEVGSPGKTLPREAHLALMLGLSLFIPWLITQGSVALARRWPELCNLPHRDYWLAPERREASLDWLRDNSYDVGFSVVLIFVLGNYFTVQAYLPPEWPQVSASAMIWGPVLLALYPLWWIRKLYQRFHKPAPEAAVDRIRQPRRPSRS